MRHIRTYYYYIYTNLNQLRWRHVPRFNNTRRALFTVEGKSLHSGQITSGTYHCEAYILPLSSPCGALLDVSVILRCFISLETAALSKRFFIKITISSTNAYEKAQTTAYTSFGL